MELVTQDTTLSVLGNTDPVQ